MESDPVEILYGVFCDFAREELHGKSTLIGTFGDKCRFRGPPPGILPTLGIHVFLLDRKGEAFDAAWTIRVPGKAESFVVHQEIRPDANKQGLSGRAINLNLANLTFDQPGTLFAHLHLGTEPAVERTFRLEIEFEPQIVVA